MSNKSSSSSLARFGRPQTRLEAAKQALAEDQTATVNQPKMVKLTNQYDLMMYEAFANDGNNNNRGSSSSAENPDSEVGPSEKNSNKEKDNKRKNSKHFPIMEPETGRICKHNLATIPSLKRTTSAEEKNSMLKSSSTETDDPNNDGTRPTNSVTGTNNLIEAKNRFRIALKTRARELGLVYESMTGKSKNKQTGKQQKQQPKRSSSKRKAASKAQNSSNLPPPSSEPKLPKSKQDDSGVCKDTESADATSFDTAIPFSGENIVIYDTADPAVFLYSENIPKYKHKMSILNGKWKDETSVSPYQIGRMWADEHFPRAFAKKLNTRPPPYYTSLSDPGGPYETVKILGTNYLPQPTPPPVDPITNLPVNLRIPEAVRNRSRSTNYPNLPEEINMWADKSAEEILALNRAHWKTVRRVHQEAARQNSARYEHSFAVLEQMYLSRRGAFPFADLFKRPMHDTDDCRQKEEVKSQGGEKEKEAQEEVKEDQVNTEAEAEEKEVEIEEVPEAIQEIEIELQESPFNNNNEDAEDDIEVMLITGEDQVVEFGSDNFFELVLEPLEEHATGEENVHV